MVFERPPVSGEEALRCTICDVAGLLVTQRRFRQTVSLLLRWSLVGLCDGIQVSSASQNEFFVDQRRRGREAVIELV